VTSKGQVTIPADIREKAGLLPHTEVEFEYDGSAVRIVKAAKATKLSRGERVVRRLAGSSRVRLTTDELLALIRDE